MSLLKKVFPHASKDFEDLNPDGIPSGADAQSSIRNGTLAEKKGKDSNPRKYAVCVTSYRTRLADAEGLCAKYFVDSLRYSGIIHDDTEAAITFQISQKKVEKKTQEKTLIEVTEL